MKIRHPFFLFLAFAVTAMAAKKTALDRYVAKPDPAYRYNLVRTHKLKGATAFVINMTSHSVFYFFWFSKKLEEKTPEKVSDLRAD